MRHAEGGHDADRVLIHPLQHLRRIHAEPAVAIEEQLVMHQLIDDIVAAFAFGKRLAGGQQRGLLGAEDGIQCWRRHGGSLSLWRLRVGMLMEGIPAGRQAMEIAAGIHLRIAQLTEV